MQKIFIEKPYRFVRPMMSNWFARLMNTSLIHSPMIRATDSIVSVESRGVELLQKSINDDHAIMMIPNHPRTSDPVVMFDLMRRVNTPIFAMASWHLFNQNWLTSTVVWFYGAYSLNREGLDKASISFSVSALRNNIRPLLMFAEGATSRTNDSLMPYLDGATFIARTAAKRRHKDEQKKTVIHPIAIRYVFLGDAEEEFEKLILAIETELKCELNPNLDRPSRVNLAVEKLVELKEKEFDMRGDSSHSPWQRRQHLTNAVLEEAELRCFGEPSRQNVSIRIRDIRAHVFPQLLNNNELTSQEREIRWRDLERTYLAWQMASYPEDYLAGNPSVDRLLDIAAKVHEDLTDQRRKCGEQKVIIEVCEPIEVPPKKYRGSEPDPLIGMVQSQLLDKLAQLEVECPKFKD